MDQQRLDFAKEMAEGMARIARETYTAEFKGEDMTLAPQAAIVAPDNKLVMFAPDVMAQAWQSRETRAEFVQKLAHIANTIGGFAITVSECTVSVAKKDEDPDEARDRHKAAGTLQDVIIVALYLPGPRTMIGGALIGNGKAQPFEWKKYDNLSGGLVAGGEQQQSMNG